APPTDRLWPSLRYSNPLSCSTILMRRDTFEQAGGFDVHIRACQDWDLWFRIGNSVRALSVDAPVTFCRSVEDSLSHDIDQMLSDVTIMLRDTLLKDVTGI